jgi:hypothetical protein
MRSADAEPNTGKASSGHDCYRLFLVADRSADHDRRFLSATFRRESEIQAVWLPQLPSKARWYFQSRKTLMPFATESGGTPGCHEKTYCFVVGSEATRFKIPEASIWESIFTRPSRKFTAAKGVNTRRTEGY